MAEGDDEYELAALATELEDERDLLLQRLHVRVVRFSLLLLLPLS